VLPTGVSTLNPDSFYHTKAGLPSVLCLLLSLRHTVNRIQIIEQRGTNQTLVGNSLSGTGVRPSANGRKQVLPTGVSTLNPDSFYHTKVGVVQQSDWQNAWLAVRVWHTRGLTPLASVFF
jgi:hypothetical protein